MKIIFQALLILIMSIATRALAAPSAKYQPKGEVRSESFSPDGKRHAISERHTVTMLDSSGRVKWVYKAPEKLMGFPCFPGGVYPNSSAIAVAELVIHEDVDGDCVSITLVGLDSRGHEKWRKIACNANSQSPDGSVIFSSDPEGAGAMLISTATGRTLWKRRDVGGMDSVFSPDGKYILFHVEEGGKGMVLLSRAGKTVWSASAHADSEQRMALARAARKAVMLVTPDRGDTQLLCLDAHGKQLWGKKLPASWLAIDPDGTRILVGIYTKDDRQVILLNGNGEILWRSPKDIGELAEWPWHFSDGKFISGDGRKGLVWNGKTVRLFGKPL